MLCYKCVSLCVLFNDGFTYRRWDQMCVGAELDCFGAGMTIENMVVRNNSVADGPGGGLSIDGTFGLESIDENEVTGNTGKPMACVCVCVCVFVCVCVCVCVCV